MRTASESKPLRITSWVLQLVLAAAFLGMGALPKLTGDPMAVELFELVGAPWARIVVGVIELVAAILLVIPRTAAYGGIAAILAMFGAIASHLGPLGIMPELTDPGTGEKGPVPMFFMAIAFLVLAAVVVYLRRDQLPLGAQSGTDTAAE